MNQLSREKSPYLLQHQHNPVHWMSWSETAWQKARKLDRPIFLSIGYATCHWCHVMEHESFEDDEVARWLNDNFVCIKLDREERPDVDQIYMDAVVGMQGHGGWPLSVFLTPTLQPFYGGTYYPKAQFIALLKALSQAWQQNRQEIESSSQAIVAAMQSQLTAAKFKALHHHKVDETPLRHAYMQLQQMFDTQNGGFGAAPKFPHTTYLSLLLRIYHRTSSKQALQMVESSLQAMAQGGIFDHLGGGFARYSTDAAWQIPHFEKMLYDNALLAKLYLEAYQVTKQTLYQQVAQATLDYICDEMQDASGGFYCAQDADSEGEEGRYYVWRVAELQALLSKEEWSKLQQLYALQESGNFEQGQNVLVLRSVDAWQLKQDETIQRAHAKLLSHRRQRPRPLKDDKILVAWNGLMISAMVKGFQVLQQPRYLHAAQAAANKIQQKLYSNSGLLKRYRDDDSRYLADLDDHAFLIQGLLDLNACDGNRNGWDWLLKLQTEQDQLFWDDEAGGYHYASTKQQELILRKKDFFDGALPSGNGVAACNLLQLHALTGNELYQQRFWQLWQAAQNPVAEHPAAAAQLLMALDAYLDDRRELILRLPQNHNMDATPAYPLWQEFNPNLTMLIARLDDNRDLPLLRDKILQQNRPTWYLCQQQSCQAPTHDWSAVHKQLAAVKTYSL